MGVPVRTTITAPRWKLPYELRHKIMEIAPDKAFLRAPKPEFTARYFAKLDEVTPAWLIEVMTRIAGQAGDGRLVLLCFEDLTKPGEWCHRSLFAEWWLDKTGEQVREIAAPPPMTPATPAPRLF
jgi:hypothetical protein